MHVLLEDPSQIFEVTDSMGSLIDMMTSVLRLQRGHCGKASF